MRTLHFTEAITPDQPKHQNRTADFFFVCVCVDKTCTAVWNLFLFPSELSAQSAQKQSCFVKLCWSLWVHESLRDCLSHLTGIKPFDPSAVWGSWVFVERAASLAAVLQVEPPCLQNNDPSSSYASCGHAPFPKLYRSRVPTNLIFLLVFKLHIKHFPSRQSNNRWGRQYS